MKKLVLITLILIAFVLILNATDLKDAKVYSVVDSTTASYVAVVTENLGGFEAFTIAITNTDDTNSLYWKVTLYATWASTTGIVWQPETSVAAGGNDYISIGLETWDKAVVEVKNNSGVAPFVIDCIFRRIQTTRK